MAARSVPHCFGFAKAAHVILSRRLGGVSGEYGARYAAFPSSFLTPRQRCRMKDSAAGMKDSTSLNHLLARIGVGSFSSAGPGVKVSSTPTSRQAENNSSRSSPFFAAPGLYRRQ